MARRRHATPAERERHLAAVERLFRDGLSGEEIAARLGCSKSQISYDLKRLGERWRQSALTDIDAKIGEQLARIDATEREAWRAWEQSKEPSETVFVEESQGCDAGRRESVRRATQTGDVAHLRTALKAVQARSKLLGLYPDPKARKARQQPGGISFELLQRIRERKAAADREISEMEPQA